PPSPLTLFPYTTLFRSTQLLHIIQRIIPTAKTVSVVDLIYTLLAQRSNLLLHLNLVVKIHFPLLIGGNITLQLLFNIRTYFLALLGWKLCQGCLDLRHIKLLT